MGDKTFYCSFTDVTTNDIICLCSEKNQADFKIKTFCVNKVPPKYLFGKVRNRLNVYFNSETARDAFQKAALLYLLKKSKKVNNKK